MRGNRPQVLSLSFLFLFSFNLGFAVRPVAVAIDASKKSLFGFVPSFLISSLIWSRILETIEGVGGDDEY
jgi:hypothetical protein